ncbi:MAG: TonB-dependent receptor [Alphaproteobacteria bacterium]|nr:TonB-dependent receptor [Alphaproteobacteria bacterium]MBU1525004.1 TonB-dependent receptor [Alphaproteobacteria bacterium]MBU2116934.1 TonB-dependent receptor [Alphaproteobacteria bacterium]MBU2349877.1 TonB-dependent receptor [Alphaproteobacteria bacterium]MBU2382466.1 TonB-dependent receptor [Alphaproteobacteria bacterium]
MKRLLLTTAAVLAAPTCVLAQETTRVDDVVVTATRLPAIVQDTPGARVIDAETIRLRGAVFAQDILADVPGLSVYRAGLGGVTSVRMRGASQDKSLVLVDGVPVNDPSQPAGGFDFLGFDLGVTERIEVLSGPQSSLWGSDAIGGVIAFTSREIDGLEADAEVGSFDTARGRLGAGTSTDSHAFGASWSRYETDGISAAASGTEADGVEVETVAANGRVDLTDRLSIEARARQSDVFAEIDDFGPVDSLDTTDTRNRSGFVRLTAAGVLGLDHQVTAAASDVARVTDSAFPSTYEGERRLLRWQADGGAGSGMVWAFGLEREETEAFLNGRAADLGVNSAFGTLRWRATGRLTLNLGLRHDSTDDFGGETTGRVSAAFALGNGFTLSGAYGTGFKTPSVSQAVCDFCFVLPGTVVPALGPESARGGEIALGWRSVDGRFDGRVTAYRLDVDDQIDGVFDPGTFEFYYVNIDETRTDGVELEGRATLGGGFDLTLAWAWTDAQDLGAGTPILRVPERAGSATLAWTGDRLSAALTVRGEGDMPDSGGTREGFVTANLNAAWRASDRVELTVRVENLGDETYEQLLGYGEPGRSGYVGVRLRY